MYRYRNKRTGVTIKTACMVTGKNWEPVEEAPLYSADGVEDAYAEVFEDPDQETAEVVPVEEAPAAEVPAPKTKTSRKGKK